MADYTLLGALTGPGANAGDPTAINLGLLFKVTSQCWVKALRFWRADTGIGGAPFGRLYTYIDEDNGTAVTGTDATFTLSGTGWQQADITPVELTVDQLYKVVINFPDDYSATGGYWATGAGVGGIVSGPLTAPDSGGNPLGIGAVKQGTFTASASLVYPTSYFNGGNYWVDVLVTDVDPTGTPLTITDSPVGARSGASADQLLAGLTHTGTATGAAASGPTEALLIGVTHSATPVGTRAAGASDVLLLDVIHTDDPRGARIGGQGETLTLDVLHADRSACARLAGPGGALLVQGDLLLLDAPAAARTGAVAETLLLGTAYTWPPTAGAITVLPVATGVVTVR